MTPLCFKWKDHLTAVVGSESLGLDAANKATAHPNGALVQLHPFGTQRIHWAHLDGLSEKD